MDERAIFAVERPHPRLLKLYVIRSILTGPGIFVALPLYFFRYHTLRYKFDEEGIHMRWGIGITITACCGGRSRWDSNSCSAWRCSWD
jgi:hypothetical protein